MRAYPSEIGADISWPFEATDRMNRMYRRQRHIYDGTRRYYLLGRDRLITGLRPDAGQACWKLVAEPAETLCWPPGYIRLRDFSASMFRLKC